MLPLEPTQQWQIQIKEKYILTESREGSNKIWLLQQKYDSHTHILLFA